MVLIVIIVMKLLLFFSIIIIFSTIYIHVNDIIIVIHIIIDPIPLLTNIPIPTVTIKMPNNRLLILRRHHNHWRIHLTLHLRNPMNYLSKLSYQLLRLQIPLMSRRIVIYRKYSMFQYINWWWWKVVIIVIPFIFYAMLNKVFTQFNDFLLAFV